MSNINKSLKTISEVSKELNIPQHVLRFWEKKFHNLNPIQKNNGRRYYTDNDVDLIKTIIDLLYNQKYSIMGAKKKMKYKTTDLDLNKKNKDLILKLEKIKIKLENLIDGGA